MSITQNHYYPYGRTTQKPQNASVSETNSVLLHEYMDYWLEHQAKPYVKQSTYALYTRIIFRHLGPALGSIPLSEINEQDIRTFMQQKLSESGRLDGNGALSEKTVREQLSLLNTIFKDASSAGLLVGNPLRNIKRPKVLNNEMRVFSTREQRKIENTVIELGGQHYLGITLCLYSGLRIGELCALRWRNINFERRTITVAATLQRIQAPSDAAGKTMIIIDTPKSRRSFRTIPMINGLVQKLREYYLSLPASRKTPDDFVFNRPQLDGNRYIEPRLFEKYFQQIMRRAGIKNANFHALRHTFATRCVELNMDVKSLSEVLGHSTVSITLNKYVHSFMEQKRKSMSKLNHILV